MRRHYFISQSVDVLESVESALERSGFDAEQIHVISNQDAQLEGRRLHVVDSLSRKGVVRYGMVGFTVGLVGAALILLMSAQTGITENFTWAPAAFLALGFLGFCTWEGGLWGIQKPNRDSERFQRQLKEGQHLFFVDARKEQEATLAEVITRFDAMVRAGEGDASPEWMMTLKKRFHQLFNWSPHAHTKY